MNFIKKRSAEEIAKEISDLKNLKPVGPFARKTAETIQIQIDALSGDVDETSDEFNELSEDDSMAALDALNWMRGDSKTKPSADWGGLCA